MGTGVDINNTLSIQREEEQCDNIEDIKKVLNALQMERPAWKERINQIINDNHYTKTMFANLCGVSRPAVSKWCEGAIPSSRDDFIRIGFAAHYNLDEMNRFLQRYGKYPALYPKSLEDSVYIFVLNSNTYPHTYSFCEKTITRICKTMSDHEQEVDSAQIFGTQDMKNYLLNISHMDQLEDFISKNAASYKSKYKKFYSQVRAYLEFNAEEAGTIYNKKASMTGLGYSQGWTSSMRQCVYAICQMKWIPLRRKVIALGIHLNLTTKQINELLGFAQMEPLCAKNPVEGAIIYAINDAELNASPGKTSETFLYEYVYKVLTELDISDAALLLNDLNGI